MADLPLIQLPMPEEEKPKTLYGYITNTNDTPKYDDIMNSDLSREDKVKQIQYRTKAYQDDLDRQLHKDYARIGFGSALSGASFHPIFNIPYVGTGIGGAMYDLGQGIVEGDTAGDLWNRTKRGFAIGETVGAIPYVGKGLSKIKAGQAVVRPLANGWNKLAQTPFMQKAEDILMTDIRAFNPNKQIAYHGSPYDFDKFANEAIGTGEGWQAHGYGHYAAKSKDVANKNYRDRLAQDYYLNGKKLSETSKEYDMIDTFNDYMTSENPTLQDAKNAYITQQEKFLERYNNSPNLERMKKATQDYIDLANSIDLNNLEVKTGGQLYKLSIPKDDVLLREGASFEKQPQIVQKGLNNIKNDYLKQRGYNSIDEINAELNNLTNQYENIVKNESPYSFYAGNEKSDIQAKISKLENLRRFNETPDLYEYLINHQHLEPQEVSNLLSKQGIKGISYNGGIDGEARVIFNPDDIDIVRRFYDKPGALEYLKSINPNIGTESAAIDKNFVNKNYWKQYAKDNFMGKSVNIPGYTTVNFTNKNLMKDYPYNMPEYPNLFEQLMDSKYGFSTNYNKENDRLYDHLINNNNNRLFDYLIEVVKDNDGNIHHNYKMMKNITRGDKP